MKNNLAKAEFDEKLIIQKADQGNTVVPVHRKDFISKCQIALQQHSLERND